MHILKRQDSIENSYKNEKKFHQQQNDNSQNFNKELKHYKVNKNNLAIPNKQQESLDTLEHLSAAMSSVTEVQKEHLRVLEKTADIVHNLVKLLSSGQGFK